jgi:hypothetical protein
MKTIKNLALFGVLLLASNWAIAQDKILLRAKVDTIQCKILEVGVNEIKYKLWPVDENMPIMVEKKDRIRRIIFENGTVLRFSEDEFTNEANYADQRKMAVKVDLYAFTRGVFSSAFEYSLRPGMSVEAGLGIIGIGQPNDEIYSYDKAQGAFVRLGIKFINTPTYYMSGMRYSHILKGGYIRPELVLATNTNTSTYNRYVYNQATQTSSYVTETSTVNVNGTAMFTNFGKQWVFSDVFCVDFFIGLGIGKKKVTYSNGNGNSFFGTSYSFIDETGGYGFIAFTEQDNKVAFSTQAGIKMGMLIGSKGTAKKK